MAIIKVWCLPPDQSEKDLNKLHRAIVAAVVSVSELGLQDQNDMTCLFPADLMKYGLGEEIIVEVSLFKQPARSKVTLINLAENISKTIKELYPQTERVECFVRFFDPYASDQAFSMAP